MSKELIEKLESYLEQREPKYPTLTLDFFFENTPEGDFSWERNEAGGWEPCYDSDSQTWQKFSYVINVGRKNGFRWIEALSCDSDGNRDIHFRYDEEEEDCKFELYHDDFSYFLETGTYFLAWAEYWLYCATEGTDQLGECFPTDYQSKIQDGTWVEFCINSAKANIKSLEGGQKFLDSL